MFNSLIMKPITSYIALYDDHRNPQEQSFSLAATILFAIGFIIVIAIAVSLYRRRKK